MSLTAIASNPERWADVPGYVGLYQVSDCGRVRALVRRGSKYHDFLNPFTRRDGYQTVNLTDWDGKKSAWLCHRLVLLSFRGAPEQDGMMHGAHLNGVKSDNRLGNLAWATPAENASHRALHGTYAFAKKGEPAKITEELVRSIRSEDVPRSPTRGRNALAQKHNLCPKSVGEIVRRKRWAHVQ